MQPLALQYMATRRCTKETRCNATFYDKFTTSFYLATLRHTQRDVIKSTPVSSLDHVWRSATNRPNPTDSKFLQNLGNSDCTYDIVTSYILWSIYK